MLYVYYMPLCMCIIKTMWIFRLWVIAYSDMLTWMQQLLVWSKIDSCRKAGLKGAECAISLAPSLRFDLLRAETALRLTANPKVTEMMSRNTFWATQCKDSIDKLQMLYFVANHEHMDYIENMFSIVKKCSHSSKGLILWVLSKCFLRPWKVHRSVWKFPQTEQGSNLRGQGRGSCLRGQPEAASKVA